MTQELNERLAFTVETANNLPHMKRVKLASILLGIPTAEIDDATFELEEPLTIRANVKIRRKVDVIHLSVRINDGHSVE